MFYFLIVLSYLKYAASKPKAHFCLKRSTNTKEDTKCFVVSFKESKNIVAEKPFIGENKK